MRKDSLPLATTAGRRGVTEDVPTSQRTSE